MFERASNVLRISGSGAWSKSASTNVFKKSLTKAECAESDDSPSTTGLVVASGRLGEDVTVEYSEVALCAPL